MSIEENLEKLRKSIPEGVTLVAVSKTKPVESIKEAHRIGQRDFGENKVQELQHKYPELPDDIRWHMIGHLQTNKVKYIAPFIHMIHAVDSFKLLKEINKQAKKHNRTINVLFQFHIALEDSKFGFKYSEFEKELMETNLNNFENIAIKGVMGMATFTNNTTIVNNEFRTLKEIFNKLKSKHFTTSEFEYKSMGMSQDYLQAIDQGSNMVRIGSTIFGERT